MLKILLFTLLAVFSLTVLNFYVAAADDATLTCTQLDEKASGGMTKYSLHGEANGPVFFSGISCAIEHRNRELCAMEMVSFDTTAKVYDYHTAEEIDISKAYFWLNENNKKEPILSFGSKKDAEMYRAATKEGVILDYTDLTDRKTEQ